jgi:hypothetical protein
LQTAIRPVKSALPGPGLGQGSAAEILFPKSAGEPYGFNASPPFESPFRQAMLLQSTAAPSARSSQCVSVNSPAAGAKSSASAFLDTGALADIRKSPLSEFTFSIADHVVIPSGLNSEKQAVAGGGAEIRGKEILSITDEGTKPGDLQSSGRPAPAAAISLPEGNRLVAAETKTSLPKFSASRESGATGASTPAREPQKKPAAIHRAALPTSTSATISGPAASPASDRPDAVGMDLLSASIPAPAPSSFPSAEVNQGPDADRGSASGPASGSAFATTAETVARHISGSRPAALSGESRGAPDTTSPLDSAASPHPFPSAVGAAKEAPGADPRPCATARSAAIWLMRAESHPASLAALSATAVAAPGPEVVAARQAAEEPTRLLHTPQTAAGSPFEKMDGSHTPQVVQSTPQRLAVAVHDPGLGWVEVRAHVTAGQVTAVVATASAAHSAVVSDLPAIREYLTGQQVRVDHLASETFSSFSGGAEDSPAGRSGSGSGSAQPPWAPLSPQPAAQAMAIEAEVNSAGSINVRV